MGYHGVSWRFTSQMVFYGILYNIIHIYCIFPQVVYQPYHMSIIEWFLIFSECRWMLLACLTVYRLFVLSPETWSQNQQLYCNPAGSIVNTQNEEKLRSESKELLDNPIPLRMKQPSDGPKCVFPKCVFWIPYFYLLFTSFYHVFFWGVSYE
jgi:hypothetical protein